MIEALLSCQVRWEEADVQQLACIRGSLLGVPDYGLKRIMSRLQRPEVCAPETYQELTRTPRMQEKLRSLGLIRKVMSEREKRRNEIARLLSAYDRDKLYKQVWVRPVQQVAKTYGLSDVRLGKVCRALQIPIPPRGYWARVRSGRPMKRPPLPKLGKPSFTQPIPTLRTEYPKA